MVVRMPAGCGFRRPQAEERSVSLSAIGQRAEAVITAKAEGDHGGLPAIFPGAAMERFGSCVATRIPTLADRAPYNKARRFTRVRFLDGIADEHPVPTGGLGSDGQLQRLVRIVGRPVADPEPLLR
jgi:hypothetical protein